ncbi:MAG: histidinol-phosphatase HisJ family protein [Clostridia bacterium]|nr:histidinol-phosphatase HisJ family protein [Clostridia bacterium]
MEGITITVIQNLHTHTNYCDGADTPEEVVLCAIEKGFSSIGFSGHSFTPYSKEFSKIGDHTEEYKKDIKSLKEKYKDRIEIYLGLEVDMFSEPDLSGYDYLIGSVHYLKKDGVFIDFDKGAKEVEEIIRTCFHGDGMAYAKAYYKTLAQLPVYGNFDIIGHFDIITKHCDSRNFFDITSKEYCDAAFEAAAALKGKIPFFEVNTGAIARGYRKTPYPSVALIKEMKRLGFGAVITADCHDKRKLDYRFLEATELLRECGYKEKYILTKNGFEAVPL